MLTLRNVTKTFNARTLFSGASMTINHGERVALVGPNGAGKSTLFSLNLKTDTPDAGEIVRDEWTTVGFLPQECEAVGDETVLEVSTGKAGEIERLEKQLSEFEAAGDVFSPEYFETHAKHDALQDPQAEAKAKRLLKGLGYLESDFDRPAREFSGGWIMRAHMARQAEGATQRLKRTQDGMLSRYTSVERRWPQNSSSSSNACKPCIARAARKAALIAPA